MKKWERSILARQLSSERDIIRRLEKSYKEALDEIDMRILALKARPQSQSVIYQLRYQEALRKQVQDVYSKMTVAWYKDIKTYLGECYEDAFFSTMYSLHQQGIPIIIPFDQEAAAEAASMDYGILGDTLSERLYKNTYTVADRTIKHITVGIASNASYGSIAANIANAANISLSNALRITRTEAHRVTQTVQYETVRKARSRGADVVKQWDSTLDNRTRPSHAALDGQIRELDEPFKVPANGHEAEHPGAFGIASEDINCRCVCLQRARWAIDRTELEKYVGDLDGMDDDQLDKMAGSLGVTRDELIRKSNGVIEPDGSVNHRISSTSYNDFKKKYWERSGYVSSVKNGGSGLKSAASSGTIKTGSKDNSGGREPDGVSEKKTPVQIILDRYPRIEGEHTYEDDIKATNPNYTGKDTAYRRNCQRCVIAYEARRRGYDVTAAPKIQTRSEPFSNMHNKSQGWPTTFENGPESIVKCFGEDAEDTRKLVIDQMRSYGEGARAIIRIVQNSNGGKHVFVSECHEGNVVFLDPQSGLLDASLYFDDIRDNETYLLRIDDKEFTTRIQNCCNYKLGD